MTESTQNEPRPAELLAKIAMLQAALDAAAEGLMVTDLEGRILTANARMGDLWSIDPAELAGERSKHAELLSPLFEDFERVREDVTRLLADPTTEALDILELTDGRVLERRSTPQVVDGEIAGRVWRFRDITDEHLARRERDVLEDRFRQTLENVSLLAVALDTEGLVTFANDFVLELTGWTREEAIGSDWFERFLPEPGVKEAFLREIETGEIPSHVEREIVTRAGTRRLISLSNSVLRDAAGAIIGTVSLGEDVTDRRRVEERYRSTLENISLVAAGIDAEGRVSFANDYLLELTGWSREEVIGNDWFERFDDNPAVKADYFDCMARGEIRQHFESTIRTRAGDVRTIRWSSTLEVGADGSPAGGSAGRVPSPAQGRQLAHRRGQRATPRTGERAGDRLELPRRDRAARASGATPALPEAGGGRPARRGHRTRLQQPPHRDRGLHRVSDRRVRGERSAPR